MVECIRLIVDEGQIRVDDFRDFCFFGKKQACTEFKANTFQSVDS